MGKSRVRKQDGSLASVASRVGGRGSPGVGVTSVVFREVTPRPGHALLPPDPATGASNSL